VGVILHQARQRVGSAEDHQVGQADPQRQQHNHPTTREKTCQALSAFFYVFFNFFFILY
jgi:hypothetical protein